MTPLEPSGGRGEALYRLLTILQVADILQASTRTVRRFIESGELEVVRVGRLVRIRPEALTAFLDKRN